MVLRKPVVRAIFRRDLKRWFGNPTGYVFITLFVLLAAVALFWPNEFFQRNLANLDTLNSWFPSLLLFFIPAVAMTIWAGERSQGTDELLLTLPASDFQIVLGKYLAILAVLALLVGLSALYPLLLFWFGNPEPLQTLAGLLGLFLYGAAFAAIGFLISALTRSQMSAAMVTFFVGLILYLIDYFAEQTHHEVVGLDLKPLDKKLRTRCSAAIVGDILDENLLQRLVSEYEIHAVYHLAALLSTRAEYTPDTAHRVNVDGTLNLLKLAHEQARWHGNPVKFLFPSSIAAYGLPDLAEELPLHAVWTDPEPGARGYDAVALGAAWHGPIEAARGDAVRYVYIEPGAPMRRDAQPFPSATHVTRIDLHAPGYRIAEDAP